MQLSDFIKLVVSELDGKEMPTGKTAIQKIVYLTLREEQRNEWYKPYFYGPYSEIVQRNINSLEYKKEISYSGEGYSVDLSEESEKSEVTDRFKKIEEFLITNDIKDLKSISNLTKIHILKHQNNVNEIEDIKLRSTILNWDTIFSLSDSDIKGIQDKVEAFDKLEFN